MVKGKIGRERLSKALDNRFMEAIDAAAMKIGDTGSDEYLAGWRSSDVRPFGENPIAQLTAVVDQLNTDYPKDRLIALIKNGGLETNS